MIILIDFPGLSLSLSLWLDCPDQPGYTVQHHANHLLDDIKCVSQPDISYAMAAAECHAHPHCVAFSLDLNLNLNCLKSASEPTVMTNNICFYTKTSPSLSASSDSRHLLASDPLPSPPPKGKQCWSEVICVWRWGYIDEEMVMKVCF